jgi:hypothetical protein
LISIRTILVALTCVSPTAFAGVHVTEVSPARRIYHAPQTPGYTAWCTLWRTPNGELRLAFQQVTGPADKPAERKNVTVILGSSDEAASWKTISEIPARSSADNATATIYASPASSNFCGHGLAVLNDGTLVTGLWANEPLTQKTGYLQRSTDAGKTWSQPIYLREPAVYKTYPTQIKQLKDGRLIAVAGTVKQADANTLKYLLKEFFESRDGGKTWTHLWTMPAEIGLCEESDFVELDTGDLLFSHRCEHYKGDKYILSNRLQSIFHRNGDGWEFGPVTAVPMPHSGFPCLVKLPDGSILHIATDGVWRTPADLSTWTRLPDAPASPYYPQATLLKDGRVLVVGHVGSDDEYGKVDQAIVAQTFRVNTASESAMNVPLGESVLLLDEHVIASTKNLTQEFFPAKRHPANPVIKRSEPWEGIGPYVWGNRLMQDPANGQFRLWYSSYEFAGNAYRWGLATSPDGLKWTKPDLGIQEVHGKPARNCLPLGPHGEKGARCIARDPRPTTPDERRFLGVRFTYDGEFVSFSPDGIHWTEHPKNPVWHVPSDIIHVMWDGRRNEFVAYFKMWELAGTQVLPSGEEKPFLAYCSTFTPKPIAGSNKADFEVPITHFKKNAPAEVTTEKLVLRAQGQGKDDGGGSSLSGAWHAKRVQVWARSEDGIHWTDEQLVLRADEKDPPTANIQYMFVIQRGGYYLAFLTLHDEAGHFDIQLAHSADGIHFKRPWRKPWLGHGPEGAFDMGMVLGPADPIVGAKEMWFPYGGTPITHDSPRQDYEQAIGLATTRLDGFSSWRATGDGDGELVTQPFRFEGDQLFVNAVAEPGGSVSVEVLDESGHAIPGFTANDSVALQGDTLADAAAGRARWKSSDSLKDLAGKQVRLRLLLRSAEVFAFRVADEATQKPRTPRATLN